MNTPTEIFPARRLPAADSIRGVPPPPPPTAEHRGGSTMRAASWRPEGDHSPAEPPWAEPPSADQPLADPQDPGDGRELQQLLGAPLQGPEVGLQLREVGQVLADECLLIGGLD